MIRFKLVRGPILRQFVKTHPKAERNRVIILQTIRLNHQFTEETNKFKYRRRLAVEYIHIYGAFDSFQLFAMNEIAVHQHRLHVINE